MRHASFSVALLIMWLSLSEQLAMGQPPGIDPSVLNPEPTAILAKPEDRYQYSLLKGHQQEVVSLDFSLDGARLASLGAAFKDDGGNLVATVKIWELPAWPQVKSRDISVPSPSTAGGTVMFQSGGKLLGVLAGSQLTLWNLESNQAARTIPDVLGFDFVPGRAILATISLAPAEFGARGSPWRLDLWGSASGKRLTDTITLDATAPRKSSVRVLASQDGKRLAIAIGDARGYVLSRWDLTPESIKNTGTRLGIGSWVSALSADGALLAIGKEVFETASPTVDPKAELNMDDKAVPTLAQSAFSPDGTWLVTGHSDGQLMLFDTQTGRRLVQLPTNVIRCLAVSPDGKTIATGNMNNIVLWSVEKLLAPKE